MIRFAKKLYWGYFQKEYPRKTLRILTSGNGRMELLPNVMGKTVEGRGSVLNKLSLRWWLHTYINMESRQLDIKFYNSEKSKMEMTTENLSLCGCLNPWENIVTKEESVNKRKNTYKELPCGHCNFSHQDKEVIQQDRGGVGEWRVLLSSRIIRNTSSDAKNLIEQQLSMGTSPWTQERNT